jgi:predicted GIY-YIG superfamily endonuclease
MDAHMNGVGSKYVQSRGYDKLLYAITADDKSHASKVEYNVKQLSKHEKPAFFREHDDLYYEH